MLRGIFYVLSVNKALTDLGLDTRSIPTPLRQAAQQDGYRKGFSAQEIAVCIACSIRRTPSADIIDRWVNQGKIRREVLQIIQQAEVLVAQPVGTTWIERLLSDEIDLAPSATPSDFASEVDTALANFGDPNSIPTDLKSEAITLAARQQLTAEECALAIACAATHAAPNGQGSPLMLPITTFWRVEGKVRSPLWTRLADATPERNFLVSESQIQRIREQWGAIFSRTQADLEKS